MRQPPEVFFEKRARKAFPQHYLSYNSSMRPVLILFAKAPIPGQVKTRLARTLGPELAAKLHSAFVEDTLEKATALARKTAIDVEFHTDVETDAWPSIRVTQRLQVSGGLGVRMYYALHHALEQGRPQAMIIGSDSPSLPASHILHLLDLPQDVALGPTDDGGYYAIGCRRTHPEMFRSVNWSTSGACKETMTACHSVQLSTAVGETWFDVDEMEDLERLRREGNLPQFTQGFFQSYKLP